MQICVIGAGYVGLVTATCLAEMGNQVVCVERDPQRVARLAQGEVPIYEPGLEALLRAQLAAGQLGFTSQLKAGIRRAEIIFIAVGTPSGEDGSADLSHVLAVADELGVDPFDAPRGVLVFSLEGTRTYAASVGLRPGDIIRAVNGVNIESTSQLDTVLKTGARGWRITIIRNGQQITAQFR